MNKLLTILALVLMLVGCGTQRPTPSSYDPFRDPAEIAQRRQTLSKQLSDLKAHQKQVQWSSSRGRSPEISAALHAQVDDLQGQIDYLEDQLASLPAVGSASYLSGDSAAGSSYDGAPCVTGSCGSVSVRGYYRKDGTYVRPHTRSRPGSGSGRSRGRR